MLATYCYVLPSNSDIPQCKRGMLSQYYLNREMLKIVDIRFLEHAIFYKKMFKTIIKKHIVTQMHHDC